MTQRGADLVHDLEWKKGEESWIDYRVRTKPYRKEEDEVRLANTKLIAAAPELFEAALEIINHYQLDDMSAFTKDQVRSMQKLVVAIQKATS